MMNGISDDLTNNTLIDNEFFNLNIVQRLMKLFVISADQFLNDNENSVTNIQNHENNEQLMLINQLDEDEKTALIMIINSILTKKRIKNLLDGKT